MNKQERLRSEHPEREALDRIRRELGMEPQYHACPVCGDARWIEGRKSAKVPVEHCETCHGKRVQAGNLLRVLIAHAREGLGG